MFYMKRTLFALLAVAVAPAAFAQYILAVDSGVDRIIKLDAQTGAVVDDFFIVDAASTTTYDFNLPKDVDVVGNEIWVTDQSADAVFRFDHAGAYVGKITGGLDNIKGAAVVGNEYWVTNAGTANGAPGNSVVRFDLSGNNLGSFSTVGSLFDLMVVGNEVLATNITNFDIERYSLTGSLLGAFHASDGVTGIDFGQQMTTVGSNVWAAGFSLPAGLYGYNAAGVQTNYFDVGLALRGLTRLGNGLMLSTGGTRLLTIDPVTGASVDIVNATGRSFQYLTPFTPVPEPATMAVLALAAFLKRRKKNKA